MRILLGYVAGGGLVLTAFRLKTKYENFSAVLMGGGLAVLYFITYIAYGFYQLFPQAVSFLLMVAITIATVIIALWYNQKIIAILGQVGAYAIPFLLSDGSGRVLVLFSYISIINVGLLILSFKKDWKILYRLAFFLTWTIYAAWMLFSESPIKHAAIGLSFLFIHFFTFYFTFLSYKILRRELYSLAEIAVLLLNALFFFFAGNFLIEDIFINPHVLTYFTLLNAFIHFVIGFIIYRLKLADSSVYQFITGLGILFITVSIPVELNGAWVTLLWSFEAAVLCWVALKNRRELYLNITIPMMGVAILSMWQDWFAFYPHLNNYKNWAEGIQPFMNLNFWFSLISTLCFGYVSWLSLKAAVKKGSLVSLVFKIVVPLIFIVLLYLVIFNEIYFAWDVVIRKNNPGNITDARMYLRQLSLIMYSSIYVTLWLILNRYYFKRKMATELLLVAAIICTGVFLFRGLIVIGDLRESYIAMKSQGLSPSMLMLYVRYICFAAVAILFWNAWATLKNISNRADAVKLFSSIFNILLLSVICNEFIHWMHLAGYQNQYKLGLSIICSLYALVLIVVGIRLRQKYLRISAIILFGITLLKLFFYDLATLPTVSKTIVLVIVGVILLVVSFLYNKYKEVIFGNDE